MFAPENFFTANSSSRDCCTYHVELQCDFPSRAGIEATYRCGEQRTLGGECEGLTEVVETSKAVRVVRAAAGGGPTYAAQRVAPGDPGAACGAAQRVAADGLGSFVADAADAVAMYPSPSGAAYIAKAVSDGGVIVVEGAVALAEEAGGLPWPKTDAVAELRWRHCDPPVCAVRSQSGALALITVNVTGNSWSAAPLETSAWSGGFEVRSIAWSPAPQTNMLACGLGAGHGADNRTAWGGSFECANPGEGRPGAIVVIDTAAGGAASRAPVATFGCPLFYGSIEVTNPFKVAAASCDTLAWVDSGTLGTTLFAGYVSHFCVDEAEEAEEDEPFIDGLPMHAALCARARYNLKSRAAAPTLCALEPTPALDRIERATIFYGLAQHFPDSDAREEYYNCITALQNVINIDDWLGNPDVDKDADVDEEVAKMELTVGYDEGTEEERPVIASLMAPDQGAPFATAYCKKRRALVVASTAPPGVNCAARIALVQYAETDGGEARWTSEQNWGAHPHSEDLTPLVTVADLCSNASSKASVESSSVLGLALLNDDSLFIFTKNRSTGQTAVCTASLITGDSEQPAMVPAPGGGVGQAATKVRVASLPPAPIAPPLAWAEEQGFAPETFALFAVPYARTRGNCTRAREERLKPLLEKVELLTTSVRASTRKASVRLDSLQGDAPFKLEDYAIDDHRARGEARCDVLEQLLSSVREAPDACEDVPLDVGWQSLQQAVSRRERRVRLSLRILKELQDQEHDAVDTLANGLPRAPRREMSARIARRRGEQQKMLDQLKETHGKKKNLCSRVTTLASATSVARPSRRGQQLVAQWLARTSIAPRPGPPVPQVDQPKLRAPPKRKASPGRALQENALRHLNVRLFFAHYCVQYASSALHGIITLHIRSHTHTHARAFPHHSTRTSFPSYHLSFPVLSQSVQRTFRAEELREEEMQHLRASQQRSERVSPQRVRESGSAHGHSSQQTLLLDDSSVRTPEQRRRPYGGAASGSRRPPRSTRGGASRLAIGAAVPKVTLEKLQDYLDRWDSSRRGRAAYILEKAKEHAGEDGYSDCLDSKLRKRYGEGIF